jgi:cullin 3
MRYIDANSGKRDIFFNSQVFKEIKEASTIDDTELKRHLQSLACAKFKILKKHPSGRDVYADDSPVGCRKSRSVPSLQELRTRTRGREHGIVSMKSENIRWRYLAFHFHFICIAFFLSVPRQACIVRIMKDRKQMNHNSLVHEVTQQLTSKFIPEPLLIKKRIEHLIEVRKFPQNCVYFLYRPFLTYLPRENILNVVKIANHTTIW